MATASPSKTGCYALGQAASFSGVAKVAAADQDIKLVETIYVGEVLCGLGITNHSTVSDVHEEEVWCDKHISTGRI
jgi:hypothetical protein